MLFGWRGSEGKGRDRALERALWRCLLCIRKEKGGRFILVPRRLYASSIAKGPLSCMHGTVGMKSEAGPSPSSITWKIKI